MPPSPEFSEMPERREAIPNAVFIWGLSAPKLMGATMTGMLRDGTIVEQGQHDELVAAGGYYAGLYEKSLF